MDLVLSSVPKSFFPKNMSVRYNCLPILFRPHNRNQTIYFNIALGLGFQNKRFVATRSSSKLDLKMYTNTTHNFRILILILKSYLLFFTKVYLLHIQFIHNINPDNVVIPNNCVEISSICSKVRWHKSFQILLWNPERFKQWKIEAGHRSQKLEIIRSRTNKAKGGQMISTRNI